MTDFSPALSLHLARCCASAAAGASPRMLSVPGTDTQAGLSPEEESVVVAFPGTDSARDILTDLRFLREPWSIGTVHRGFASAELSIFDDLRDALSRYRSVLVSGHSLGGALALLTAWRLASIGFDVRGVYTFGGPRVGNWTFARAYHTRLGDRTWRVVNNRDPVPHLPPALHWRPLGYHHTGAEVFLPPEGPLVVDQPWGARLSRLVEAALSDADRREFFCATDHPIAAYIRRLARL